MLACTVWLIQYSYAVDYCFMIYTAHFFALILPRKVQYDISFGGRIDIIADNIYVVSVNLRILQMLTSIIWYVLYIS